MKEAESTVKKRVREARSRSRVMEECGISGVCMGLLTLGSMMYGWNKAMVVCVGSSVFGVNMIREMILLDKDKSMRMIVVESVVMGVMGILIGSWFMYSVESSYEKDWKEELLESEVLSVIYRGVFCRIVGRSVGRIAVSMMWIVVISVMTFVWLVRTHRGRIDRMWENAVGGMMFTEELGGGYIKIGPMVKLDDEHRKSVEDIMSGFILPIVSTFRNERKCDAICVTNVKMGSGVVRYGEEDVIVGIDGGFEEGRSEDFKKVLRAVGLITYDEEFFGRYIMAKSVIPVIAGMMVITNNRWIKRLIRSRWIKKLVGSRWGRSDTREFAKCCAVHLICVSIVGIEITRLFGQIHESIVSSKVHEFVEESMKSESIQRIIKRGSASITNE